MTNEGSGHLAAAAATRRWLGAAIVLGVGAAWIGLLRREHPQGGPRDDLEYRREFLSYTIGLILALALTGAAFGMVNWSIAAHFWIEITIGALALIQIMIHFRFFLHIDLSKQKREDLELILFSSLILILMAGGTIWILSNLASRM